MKRLTRENFLEKDPANEAFKIVDSLNSRTLEDFTLGWWAERVLAIKLTMDVPTGVQEVFVVAQAIMLYGFFFYPLFTVGIGHAYRAGEAATREKCRRLNAPPGAIRTFDRQIKWLLAEQVIDEADGPRWEALRSLRNSFSHPEGANVLMPGPMLDQLQMLADDINGLYRNPE